MSSSMNDGIIDFEYRGSDITIRRVLGSGAMDSRHHWEYQYKIDNHMYDPTDGIFNSNFYNLEEVIESCKKAVDEAIELERIRLWNAVHEIENERKKTARRSV